MERKRPSLRDWTACGLLVLAVLVLLAPAVIHPYWLPFPTFSPHSDISVIHWPKAQLMADTWRQVHRLPLWNPDNLSGMPLAANQLAMLFYPPAWLFLVLPLEPAFNLLLGLHLLWAGLGVYWLLRRAYGLWPLPALAGGLTMALNGKILAHLAGGHVSMLAALAWLPWALMGLILLLRSGRWPWALLTAVALAMQLCTHTLISLYSVYLLLGYCLWWVIGWWREGHSRERLLPLLPALVAIPLLAAALSAVQLLPLAELAGFSNRSLSLAQAAEYSLTPLQLAVGLLLPSAAGGHEFVIYLGLVPLILAAWGLGRRYPDSWLYLAVLLLALLFALGRLTPLFGLAYRWLPGLRWVRTPARTFFVAALALSLLAGFGAQRLAGRRLVWSNLAAVAVGTFCLALGLGVMALSGQVNRAGLALALLPGLSLLILGLVAGDKLPGQVGLGLLVLLLAADLLSFDLGLRHFVSPAQALAGGRATATYLAEQPGLFRTYSPSYSLPAQTAAWAGLQTADGVEPVHLSVYDRFMEAASGLGPLSDQPPPFSVTVPRFPADAPLDLALSGVQPDLTLLGLLNVGYLASAFPLEQTDLQPLAQRQDVYVYANQRVLPRAWCLPAGEVEDSNWLSVPSSADVWSQQLYGLAGASTTAPAVEVTVYRPDRIQLEKSPGAACLLVLSEMWYPGWSAQVDGRPAPVERVAGLLRGVALPEGVTGVTLAYRPQSVAWGSRLSLAGWAVVLALGLYAGLFWRHKAPQD